MPSRAFWRTDSKAPTTLYAELIRRGLPADYARRTADELDDHRADLIADLRAGDAGAAQAIADERLGETRVLARGIATDYRRRSWFGRWPLVSSLLLAPATFAVIWVLISTLVVVTVHAVEGRSMADDGVWRSAGAAWWIATLSTVAASYVAPVALAWLAVQLLMRRAASRAAAMIACLSIALVNGTVGYGTIPHPDDPTRASNTVTVFVGPMGPADLVPWSVIPIRVGQLTAVLAVGVLGLAADARRRQRAMLASIADAPVSDAPIAA